MKSKLYLGSFFQKKKKKKIRPLPVLQNRYALHAVLLEGFRNNIEIVRYLFLVCKKAVIRSSDRLSYK